MFSVKLDQVVHLDDPCTFCGRKFRSVASFLRSRDFACQGGTSFEVQLRSGEFQGGSKNPIAPVNEVVDKFLFLNLNNSECRVGNGDDQSFFIDVFVEKVSVTRIKSLKRKLFPTKNRVFACILVLECWPIQSFGVSRLYLAWHGILCLGESFAESQGHLGTFIFSASFPLKLQPFTNHSIPRYIMNARVRRTYKCGRLRKFRRV